jgi:atlastin
LFLSHSYALPLAVALVSFILRWIADATCSPYSTVCKKSSDFLSHVYAVVIIFLIIVGATKAKQVKDIIERLKGAVQLLSDGGKAKKD